MPTIIGPCIDCGTVIEKYVRPGKQLRCLTCAIDFSIRVQRETADRTSQRYRDARAAGEAVGRQLRTREGPAYERWVGGMSAFLMGERARLERESATVRGNKRRTRRPTPEE